MCDCLFDLVCRALYDIITRSTYYNTSHRMLVLRTPAVLPNRIEWVGMLLAIGCCRFFAQVRTRYQTP